MPGEKTVEGMLVTLKFGKDGRRIWKYRKLRYKPSALYRFGRDGLNIPDVEIQEATRIVFVDHSGRPRIWKDRNLPTADIAALDAAYDRIEKCPICEAPPATACDAGLHS